MVLIFFKLYVALFYIFYLTMIISHLKYKVYRLIHKSDT